MTDTPSNLQLSLRWTIPGVGLLLFPWALQIQHAISARFGMPGLGWGPNPTGPWGIPLEVCVRIAGVYALLSMIAALLAFAYALPIDDRPFVRLAIILFNVAVLISAAETVWQWSQFSMTDYLLTW